MALSVLGSLWFKINLDSSITEIYVPQLLCILTVDFTAVNTCNLVTEDKRLHSFSLPPGMLFVHGNNDRFYVRTFKKNLLRYAACAVLAQIIETLLKEEVQHFKL